MKTAISFTTLEVNIPRHYQTYAGWKRAIKALNPDAVFHGDKDICSADSDRIVAEWDGAAGTIERLY